MNLVSRMEAWRDGDVRVTNAALSLLGLVLVLLSHQFVAEMNRFKIGFSGVSLLSVIVYSGAVLIVLTQPVNRWSCRIAVGFAVAMYAIPYLSDPYLSSDIYRYVWDGVVQHAHISPYRYVPGDPALTFLRAPNQEIFDNINRRDYARTIYPPMAQMLYWLATWFAPTVEAMKLMMLGFVGVTAAALCGTLERLGRPRAEVLLFLWSPLLVWEVGNAGHVDAIVCGFIALALLFRLRNQPVLTGLFLGCAVMTKFYPIALVPALYQRRDWKMPAVLCAVIAVGYACYLSVGKLVFGFLFGYSKEEGIDSGSRFFLLDYVHSLPIAKVPKWGFLLFSAVVLGAVVRWAWVHATCERIEPEKPAPFAPAFVRAAGMIAFAFMLLFSPHYAWYILWLLPFMTLRPSVALFTYVLGFFYGYTTSLAMPGPKMFLLNTRLYAAVGIAFVLDMMMRRRWLVWKRLVSTERMRCGVAVREVEEARSVGA